MPIFFVIVRTDPLRRINRTAFQRLIDFAAGNLLPDHAEFAEHLTGEAADAHLQALEIGQRFDFLAVPAAHLHAGVAGGELNAAVILEQIGHRLQAAAVIHPGVLLARVEPEGQCRGKGEGRVFADVVIRRGVAALHGAVLHGIKHLQAGDDFTGSEYADLEFAVGAFRYTLRQDFGSAVQRVEGFRETGREPPLDHRLRVNNRRRGHRARSEAETGLFQE